VIELIQQAAELQSFLRERGWRFCIIGGVAIIRWGEPRLTRDVDVSLFAGFGGEEMIANTLLAEYSARIDGAAEFARVNRVLLLQGKGGIPIDVALAAFPFEEQMIARATDFEYVPGISLRTASAEDLIVLKAFANRMRDWTDIAGVVAKQGSALNWHAIRDRLDPLVLLKGEPEIIESLERLRLAAP